MRAAGAEPERFDFLRKFFAVFRLAAEDARHFDIAHADHRFQVEMGDEARSDETHAQRVLR